MFKPIYCIGIPFIQLYKTYLVLYRAIFSLSSRISDENIFYKIVKKKKWPEIVMILRYIPHKLLRYIRKFITMCLSFVNKNGQRSMFIQLHQSAVPTSFTVGAPNTIPANSAW